MSRWQAWAAAVCCACGAFVSAQAGVMTKASMAQAFPSPYIVGEKDAGLPVWPIYKQDATQVPLVGYVFESADLAPIPGFSGTPMNLLIALDPKGSFIDVRVLSHHEPVFLDGLGEAPLLRFVDQYRGLSLRQSVKIGSNANGGDKAGSANVYIDGVAKATASVRILNQSLLAASLKVARDKLGFAAGRDPDLVGRVRADVFEAMDWPALRAAGLVHAQRLVQRDVDAAFAGSAGEGLDSAAPDSEFITLQLAWLSVPSVGRNLLGERGWAHLRSRLDEGDHALLLVGQGRYSFMGEGFVRGAVPDRLGLRQGELSIELRDLDLDDPLALPASLRQAEAKVFRVIGPAGLDPSLPIELRLRVTRSKGIVYPERVSRDFPLRYQLPSAYVQPGARDEKTWQGIWAARAGELAVLVAALALLAAVLAKPGWVTATPGRLWAFRTGFLTFALVFVGWFAQGQLSIVNATALVQALVAGRSLGFFLFDPMTVVLWAFVLGSLVVWGRGTFCGWLCPFGALQELVSLLAQRLGVRRWRLHRLWDQRLKTLKYGALAATLAAAVLSGPWTDSIVEFEPFKTAITLLFVRSWPFVAWALLLVLGSALLYKGFCRYLCPLGAGLALLGRLRRIDWIARRAECGTPCQTCRHRCDYQAIRTDGSIVYDECFQCLDCVAIHDDPLRCAPLIAQGRGGRRPFPVPVVRLPAAGGVQ